MYAVRGTPVPPCYSIPNFSMWEHTCTDASQTEVLCGATHCNQDGTPGEETTWTVLTPLPTTSYDNLILAHCAFAPSLLSPSLLSLLPPSSSPTEMGALSMVEARRKETRRRPRPRTALRVLFILRFASGQHLLPRRSLGKTQVRPAPSRHRAAPIPKLQRLRDERSLAADEVRAGRHTHRCGHRQLSWQQLGGARHA